MSGGGDVWPVDESLLNSLKEQYKRDRVNAKRGAVIGAHLKSAAASSTNEQTASSSSYESSGSGSSEGVFQMLLPSCKPLRALQG